MGTAVAVPERGIDQDTLRGVLTLRAPAASKTLLWLRFFEPSIGYKPIHP
jgi:hypothetical protein